MGHTHYASPIYAIAVKDPARADRHAREPEPMPWLATASITIISWYALWCLTDVVSTQVKEAGHYWLSYCPYAVVIVMCGFILMIENEEIMYTWRRWPGAAYLAAAGFVALSAYVLGRSDVSAVEVDPSAIRVDVANARIIPGQLRTQRGLFEARTAILDLSQNATIKSTVLGTFSCEAVATVTFTDLDYVARLIAASKEHSRSAYVYDLYTKTRMLIQSAGIRPSFEGGRLTFVPHIEYTPAWGRVKLPPAAECKFLREDERR